MRLGDLVEDSRVLGPASGIWKLEGKANGGRGLSTTHCWYAAQLLHTRCILVIRFQFMLQASPRKMQFRQIHSLMFH